VRLLFVALAALTGCQPHSPVAPDGGDPGDAGPALIGCATPPGPTWIVSQFGLLPPEQGFDLVGDGKVHNELGQLAPFANNYWAQSTKNGDSIFLLDMPGLGPVTVDASNFPFNFFVGIDAHDPPDPTNNLTGNGTFLVPIQQFDVSCQPIAGFFHTVLKSEVLTASTPRLDIVAQVIGDFVSSDDALRATFAPDGQSLEGQIGGVSVPCSMTKVSSPLAGSGNFTLLDTIVSVFKLQPDIDRDHDGGLDRFVGDGTKIVSCSKPDGTVIAGHACPCDPRIQDGYSLAFFFKAVTAHIVGLSHGG